MNIFEGTELAGGYHNHTSHSLVTQIFLPIHVTVGSSSIQPSSGGCRLTPEALIGNHVSDVRVLLECEESSIKDMKLDVFLVVDLLYTGSDTCYKQFPEVECCTSSSGLDFGSFPQNRDAARS